jgi:hypothetical protein
MSVDWSWATADHPGEHFEVTVRGALPVSYLDLIISNGFKIVP